MDERRDGFTLIELLVVIAIIALLVTILMPTLNQAKELARQAVCATQLHALGRGSHVFAAEHDGLFPRTGGSATQGHQIRPTTVTDNYDKESKTWVLHGVALTEYGIDKRLNVPAWQGHGTSITTWRELGMTDPSAGGFDCPSSEFQPEYRVEGVDPGWSGMGARWLIDYTIISGVRYDGGDNRTHPGSAGPWAVNWCDLVTFDPFPGVAQPAYESGEEDAGEHIIAADRVEDHQGRDSGNLYGVWHTYSNHGHEDDRPTYQNIIYGDGHVSHIGHDIYRLPIGVEYGDYSQICGGGNPDGASGRWKYHWWGQPRTP